MLSLKSRIARLERAASTARTEVLSVEVVFIGSANHRIPPACADGLIAREHAERPWRAGESPRYLLATEPDGRCVFCGEVHPDAESDG